MRGILKRKFAEVDDEDPFYSSSPPSSSLPSPASTEWESDGESSSSESQDSTTNGPAASPASQPIQSILKRPKLEGRQSNVSFDLVTVFYFPRCQGFTSVPSRGGASLGMLHRHSTLRRYTVAEHALEQRSWRREKLRERRREEKLEALRHKLIANGTIDQRESERLTAEKVPDGDTDVHITDAELEDAGSFLQPYSYKHRQALLRAAGVKHIDKEEKRQLHALRVFREDCGCNCQGFCEPETCECSLAGIKCQMDNSNFPCGCTKDGCANIQGRVEFNSRRVQTHYIHTVMRLELERQLQDDTPDQLDHQSAAAPEDLQLDVDQGPPAVDVPPEKSCPFGLSAEDEGLPLTMPPTPSYHFSPERSVVEENSCCSDMTDSSCSSSQSEDSDDVGGSPSPVDMDDGGLAHAFSLCDCENDNRQPRHVNQPLNSDTYSPAADTSGPLCALNTSSAYMDNISRASMADCLDENANQATDFLSDSSLDDFPNTPSPSIDYSSGSYMDLSLSSDSDLEFFNTDYTSGPLHNSFKGHRHPDNLRHLQLLSPSSPPRYDESSTCLLESLIGLSEPSPEQAYPFRDDNQFWEVIQ